MTWGMVAIAGASLVGGAMSASGAKSAANSQVGAANRATDAQTNMFNQTVGLEAPFRSTGIGAMNKLSYLLGVPPGSGTASSMGGSGSSSSSSSSSMSPQAPTAGGWNGFPTISLDGSGVGAGSGGQQFVTVYQEDGAGNPQPVRIPVGSPSANQQFQAQSTTASGMANGDDPSSDPAYGSLLKPFGMDDFQLDPGIQFQLKYGQQALQNSQAAKNGVLSGGALKDLMGFNQDYAGLGYQSAFDRYMTNKKFTLGSLMDMTNMGQAAAGNTVNAAPSFSTGIAGTITGAGNAAAAGTVGAANALSGGIQGAGNSYFLNSLLNKGGSPSGTPAGGVIADDPIANYA